MNKLPLDLSTLADVCQGELIGNGERMIQQLCAAHRPMPFGLAFVGSAAVANKLTADTDVNYIVKPEWQHQIEHGICHDNPQQAFRLILLMLTQTVPAAQIADSAIVSDSAQLADNVQIGNHAVIGDNVSIGAGCVIGSNTVIEAGCILGENTHIAPNVTLHQHTNIGRDCVIAAGAVIGGQGFGFSLEGGRWEAIPQIGRVIIGNAVHIGANSCIDRGAIDDTVIGNNVIIDNLVHIAHNVRIGDGTAMAAGVGIAGSAEVGKHCLLAGQVGVVGHIRIADGVQINGGARVLQSLKTSGAYAGSFHVMPVNRWNRAIAYFKRLETLFKREKSQ